jgi:murein DD-endopeptidase MepM/ murein hydrolase activator NlpD
MTYSLRIKTITRWNRLLAIAIATCLAILSWQNWQTSRVIASDVPEEVLLAQDVSAVWSKGSFPVENFQSYTSPFGYRFSPVNGERQFHNGLDMAAPRGSYIRSWWAGKIIDLSDDTAGGTLITIQSGAWTHSYCHLEGYVEDHANGRYLVDSDGGIQLLLGQNIPAGARIGRIGMSGRTTGPHLHWVLKNNGSYVDPALVLKEMFKRQTVSSVS